MNFEAKSVQLFKQIRRNRMAKIYEASADDFPHVIDFIAAGMLPGEDINIKRIDCAKAGIIYKITVPDGSLEEQPILV